MSGFFAGFFSKSSSSEIPEIYPLSLRCVDFSRADILATYMKILTDTAERTHGLEDKQWPLLWDSCVQGINNQGLITMLAQAMFDKSDLFLVYIPSVNVLRKADQSEQRKIEEDYKNKAESPSGVWISFKNYRKTDMLIIYSALEYCVMSSLHKSVNIAKAVQIKISDLRAGVSLKDADIAVQQAMSLADSLRKGLDVMLDAKDAVTTSTPDIKPAQEAIGFIDAKRAFILGFPLAYISGLQATGIGSTGDADARAIDRGLKQFFTSIIQPVFEKIFKVNVEYRPDDYQQIETGLEVLKVFDLVSDSYLSAASKQVIAARMFDIDPAKEKQILDKESAERGSDTTLNGAQVSAMASFLEQLAAGTLAADTAIAALMVSFNMSREDAEAIVLPMQSFKAKTINVTPTPSRAIPA